MNDRLTANPALPVIAAVEGGLGSRLIEPLFRNVRAGSLSVVAPDGGRISAVGPLPGPAARLDLHSWRALGRIAWGGSVGLARSYVAGDWDSPDLAAVMEFAARNLDASIAPKRLPAPVRALRRVRHLIHANTRPGSRRNIASHYDLGNGFYRAWLDESMTYSSALFSDEAVTLAEAQQAKYRRLLELIDPREDDHVLEIGCGWGGFALFAARERGVRVTAITISRAQHREATRRVAAAGLSGRVRIQLRDYRDVTERYDHVVSIEMLEAVGEAYWPLWFGTVARCLRPGGRAAVQSITIDDALLSRYRAGADFIQTCVFPGGMLPSRRTVAAGAGRAGLALVDDIAFGAHYGRTLAEWRQRFNQSWPSIGGGRFDERFRRFWTFYLAYCEGGFRSGRIDVRQFLLSKPAR